MADSRAPGRRIERVNPQSVFTFRPNGYSRVPAVVVPVDRPFRPDDGCHPGLPDVSHRLPQERFFADPRPVGRLQLAPVPARVEKQGDREVIA